MSHAWIQGRRPPQTRTNGSKAGARRKLGHWTVRLLFVEGGIKPFLSWTTAGPAGADTHKDPRTASTADSDHSRKSCPSAAATEGSAR
jgi:hypothetical protein